MENVGVEGDTVTGCIAGTTWVYGLPLSNGQLDYNQNYAEGVVGSSGSITCTTASIGSDPHVGVDKTCWC